MSGFDPKKISIYYNKSLDPGWNLALEEHLLKNKDENFLILWRNKRAIVTGKHQVSYREVNYPFCIENNIPVHRRLSGGGTVYHDSGNLNFTLIENRPDRNKLIDFKRYLTPIATFLNETGIPAELSDRNDLLVNGFKVSGNAQHIEQKLQRVIHHGTLLVDADLRSLGSGLRSTAAEYETKAVDSVRSKVINLNDLHSTHLDMEDLIHRMSSYFAANYNGSEWLLTDGDIKVVDDLAKSKYDTWEWNIGYSPKYTVRITKAENELIMEVKNGKILNAVFRNPISSEKANFMIGLEHSYDTMRNLIDTSSALNGFKWQEMF